MWVEVEPENVEKGIQFSVDVELKFKVEVTRPANKPDWNFAGWIYLLFSGNSEGTWKKVFLGKKQIIVFSVAEIDSAYTVIFSPVEWLKEFVIRFWKWIPVYDVKYLEIQVTETFREVLFLDFSRKEFTLVNLGGSNVEIYWGDLSKNTIILNPGIGLENETDKRGLSARATSGIANIRIIERSEK